MSARRTWGVVLAALLLVGCAPVSPHEGAPTAPPTTGTASASDAAGTDDGQSARQGDATADVMRGVTLDGVDDLGAAERAIDALPFTATVRLVTDPERGPDDYQEAITALSSRARLVVQLVDSTAMAGLGVEEARSRARAFVERYAGQVEVWEVGNEVNGAWAGTGPQEINAKVLAMAEQVRAAGEPTAITVNLWSRPDCYEEEWEDEAAYLATVPAPMRPLATPFSAPAPSRSGTRWRPWAPRSRTPGSASARSEPSAARTVIAGISSPSPRGTRRSRSRGGGSA